jgi:acetylglutamate/LysW-gamma-L-alpha-aminoadipate kinase
VDGLIIEDKIVGEISANEAKSILPQIGFGMEKKVLACTEAIDMGVKEAIISSGQKQDPITNAITHNNCTVIHADRS